MRLEIVRNRQEAQRLASFVHQRKVNPWTEAGIVCIEPCYSFSATARIFSNNLPIGFPMSIRAAARLTPDPKPPT